MEDSPTRSEVDGVTYRVLSDRLDAIDGKISGINLAGVIGDRPAANSVPVGTLYFATDEGVIYVSDGASWNVAWEPTDIENLPLDSVVTVLGLNSSGDAARGYHSGGVALQDDGVSFSGSIAETTLLAAPLAIPANTLVVGDVLSVEVPVFLANISASPGDYTTKVYVNGTSVLVAPAVTVPSALARICLIQVRISVQTIGVAGSMGVLCQQVITETAGVSLTQVSAAVDSASTNMAVTALTGVNTTGSIPLNITATHSTADGGQVSTTNFSGITVRLSRPNLL
jgi:hypothetical protein